MAWTCPIGRVYPGHPGEGRDWAVAGDGLDGRGRRRRTTPAVDQSGLPAAQVAELAGLLPGLPAAAWPEGMRVLVRRERPHPGAQISVFEAHDGWRYHCLATDAPTGQLAFPGGPTQRPR